MDRKTFLRLSALGSASLLIPTNGRLATTEEVQPVFWPLLGRLILTTAVTHIVPKVIDYVAEQLGYKEKSEPQTIIHQHHHTHSFSPVYEYDRNDDDYLFAARPLRQSTPDNVFFFSKEDGRSGQRMQCANLCTQELSGLTTFTEFYLHELEQTSEDIGKVLLPRKISSRQTYKLARQNGGSTIYNTHHGQVSIQYTRQEVESTYIVKTDYTPYHEVKTTKDLRYRRREYSQIVSI